jgi:hypothetical protein
MTTEERTLALSNFSKAATNAADIYAMMSKEDDSDDGKDEDDDTGDDNNGNTGNEAAATL